MKKAVTVPRAALPSGIQKCLQVVLSRLDETTVLLDGGLDNQAAVLFSFAIEEFGKASWLWTEYRTGVDPVTFDDWLNHKEKLKEAARYIPEQHLLLRGFFDPKFFDPAFFDVAKSADWDERMAGLYVDWDTSSGTWRYGVEVDPETLRRSIAGVRAATHDAQAKWTA